MISAAPHYFIAALITLFIPNTVDHPVHFLSLIIGVWCKQDGDTGYWIKDLHKVHSTQSSPSFFGHSIECCSLCHKNLQLAHSKNELAALWLLQLHCIEVETIEM